MAQNMAHFLSIPVRFQFLRIPTTWEIRSLWDPIDQTRREFVFPRVQDDGSLDAFKVRPLDGWKCRDDFLGIPEGDNEKLLNFLRTMGVWDYMKGTRLESHWSEEVMEHYRLGHPVPIAVSGLWRFREAIKRALLKKQDFKETYASPLPRPETGFELKTQSGIVFPLHFELTRVASGMVTISEARYILLATVFADVSRGIRFKVCKRKDCDRQQVFPIQSKHKRDFCCMYCGHLVSLRRKRAKESAEKRRLARQNPCTESMHAL
jgi:hypothetical protein